MPLAFAQVGNQNLPKHTCGWGKCKNKTGFVTRKLQGSFLKKLGDLAEENCMNGHCEGLNGWPPNKSAEE